VPWLIENTKITSPSLACQCMYYDLKSNNVILAIVILGRLNKKPVSSCLFSPTYGPF
jgi:hypothetical protein